MEQKTSIKDLQKFENQFVRLEGWVSHVRSSGKISFVVLRDGSGDCQCVFLQKQDDDTSLQQLSNLSLESSVRIWGQVTKRKSSYEIKATKIQQISDSPDYPIAKKAHGVDFLLNHRHLWLRSKKQRAILHIRNEIIKNIHGFFQQKEFICLAAPILVPTASEGTSSLFSVNFFEEEQVFLSQSGQLHMEAGAAALGKVYCFGPTFRAEKSSTRKHLLEFWMIEPEMAFYSYKEAMVLAEQFVEFVVQNTLKACKSQMLVLERNTEALEKIRAPFYRLSYAKACEMLKKDQPDFISGKDFGAKDEAFLSQGFDKPVFIHHYPKNIKSFYMKEDPEDPSLSLSFDLLATESYGELIGGSQREEDNKILIKNMLDHGLNKDHFKWYLDLRKYGSFPHSGFGMGLERLLSWICGLDHIREASPFPRLYGRSFFELYSK